MYLTAQNKNECPVCKGKAESQLQENNHHFVACECCGRFEYHMTTFIGEYKYDLNKLASFLYYNGYISQPIDDYRYFNYLGPEIYFKEVSSKCFWTKRITPEDVDNWYPKTFSEKIDMILLGLAKLNKYDGSFIKITSDQAFSALFVKRFINSGEMIDTGGKQDQANFYLEYLDKSDYLESQYFNNTITFKIKTKGLERIDLLQKNLILSKTVFIAMSFAQDMKEVQEAIIAAVKDAGYNPRIMNEIEHNNQIVPEMLYEIKKCKFAIAELTNHNNGAYYEAGYAAGLGKEVIHLCKKDNFFNDGHFDVKQKATILWDRVEEIKDLLYKRIKATII